jgi:hypothetical protein
MIPIKETQMPISRLSAGAIFSNPDVEVNVGKGENGKYAGSIWVLTARGDWRMMLSCEPQYETAEEAKAVMQKVVDDIKAGPDPFTSS